MILRSIFNVGVNPSNSFEVNKNIKIINTISIYGIAITLLFTLATLPLKHYFYTTVCLATIVSLAIVVYLNKRGKHAISKSALMIVLPLIVLFFTIAFGSIGNEYYLFAEIIFLFFLFRKTVDRILVFAYLSIIFIFIKAAIQYSLFISVFPMSSWLYYPNIVFAFILSFLGLNLFFKEHIRYQELVEGQNLSLREKHAEISEKKDELEKLNLVKDKLFSVIGHDLRGPLRSLITLLDLFGKDHIDSDQLKEQLPKIYDKLNNTTNLTENLLVWAKSQLKGIRPKTERFDLNDEIKNTLYLFAENLKSKQLNVHTNLETPCFLVSDREILKTILRNLIHNAIKFSHQNTEIRIIQTRDESHVVVEVVDQGEGMEDSFVERFNHDQEIITRTGTAGETGTGLGLMLVKDFLSMIGGQIYLKSKLTKGSTFTLTLPTHGPKSPETSSP